MPLGHGPNIIKLLQKWVGRTDTQRVLLIHGNIYGDLVCKGMRKCYHHPTLCSKNLQTKADTIPGSSCFKRVTFQLSLVLGFIFFKGRLKMIKERIKKLEQNHPVRQIKNYKNQMQYNIYNRNWLKSLHASRQQDAQVGWEQTGRVEPQVYTKNLSVACWMNQICCFS